MRPLILCLLCVSVFGTLLMLDPVALGSLGWAAVSGRFGTRPQIVSAAIGSAVLGCVAVAFLWRPKPPARGRRGGKRAVRPRRRGRPARRSGASSRRGRQRSKA